jgi:hypothetical protein
MLTLGPFREADLAHTQRSLLAHGERILAYSRLPVSRMAATGFGLIIDQSGATRKWQSSDTGERCHLLNLVKLDDFGVHALIAQKSVNVSAGDFVALCPAYEISAAAQYLRVVHLGSRLHLYTDPEAHAAIAGAALKIPERPANDNRVPGVSKIRCGSSFRFDPNSARAAEDYFNLPASLDAEPTLTVELGGESSLVLAHAESAELEPLRAIITRQFFVPTAVKDLLRWLKSNRKEIA